MRRMRLVPQRVEKQNVEAFQLVHATDSGISLWSVRYAAEPKR